ncbi:Ras family small GTPase (macronuclear) [Tetrahymena thermophila SB210]|uniref:Ras family small GTPase n=2 Tax=Tetrahymena thermophila TaxID=5911 RepID=Q22NH8_TETTS|nr:Ras family small GTPase [Tetrahymena thermophila SB210]EAR86807.2 Ras family small GTPase [Tetrahymena thermophila SB210]BAJ21322.1 Rab-family small GTPase RabX1F [Tetrahymena thermophila]|eukprot:XP_001007052.2 Ras family small GTPase [Tetrahymena thermophila SB210]
MSTQNDSIQKTIKCILVGDRFVGKSAIFYSHIYEKVVQYLTNQADCQVLRLKKGNVEIKFQFWDLNELTREKTLKYYRQTSILMIIYDVTNRNSFTNIKNYYKDFVEQENQQSIIALVGNKKDLNESRLVSFFEGQNLAKSLGVEFFEVSAFTGDKIKDLYDFLMNKQIDFVEY